MTAQFHIVFVCGLETLSLMIFLRICRAKKKRFSLDYVSIERQNVQSMILFHQALGKDVTSRSIALSFTGQAVSLTRFLTLNFKASLPLRNLERHCWTVPPLWNPVYHWRGPRSLSAPTSAIVRARRLHSPTALKGKVISPRASPL